MSHIQVKRVYEPIDPNDGYRILVDRLWPRGISREKAGIDQWLKQLSPSNELRKWYNHEQARWPAFKERYLEEIRALDDSLKQELKSHLSEQSRVTFLFSSKELTYNNALALKQFCDEGLI